MPSSPLDCTTKGQDSVGGKERTIMIWICHHLSSRWVALHWAEREGCANRTNPTTPRSGILPASGLRKKPHDQLLAIARELTFDRPTVAPASCSGARLLVSATWCILCADGSFQPPFRILLLIQMEFILCDTLRYK